MDSSPNCRFCGRNLTVNEQTGRYECLACTFRKMDDENIIDHPVENTQHYQTNQEKEYLEALRIQEFQRNLQGAAPKLIVTKILVALNIIVYFYVSIRGGDFGSPENQLLMDLGANNGERIFAGEWWRLFTSMFLHGGLTHLAFNMYALWIIGNIVEKLFGEIGYTAIYFVSGILGGMLSLYNHPPYVVGVGASGAVFGIFGALISYAYFKKMPHQISGNILKNAALMIVINLAIGFSIPQIDNSAHIGGCIAGIIAAFFIGQDINNVNRPKRKLVSIAVAVFTGALVVLIWKPVAEKNSTNKDERLIKFEKDQAAIDKAIKDFNELENQKEALITDYLLKFQKGEILPDKMVEIIDSEFIEVFKSEGKKLKEHLNKEYVLKEFKLYTSKYLELYMSYWQNLKKFAATGEVTFFEKAKEIKREVLALKPNDFK